MFFVLVIGILELVFVGLMDVLNLLHVRMVDQLVISALSNNFSFVHDHNLVSQMHKVDCMSHQDSCLVFENTLEDLSEDLFTSLGV